MKKLQLTLLLMAGIAVCSAAAGCGNKKEPMETAVSADHDAQDHAEKDAVNEAMDDHTDVEKPWTEPAAEGQEERQPEKTAGMVGMPNPITEYGSLDEINKRVGCTLSHLGVMGITDTLYAIVDCREFQIARYEFEFLGSRWSFEAAPTKRDISGIYVKEGLISELAEPGTVIQKENYRYTRWFDGEMQYSLCVFDSDAVTENAFEEAMKEFQDYQMTAKKK